MSTKENPLNITETSFFPFFIQLFSVVVGFFFFLLLLFVLFLFFFFLRNMSKKGTDSKGLPTPAPSQPWGWVSSQFARACCRKAPPVRRSGAVGPPAGPPRDRQCPQPAESCSPHHLPRRGQHLPGAGAASLCIFTFFVDL